MNRKLTLNVESLKVTSFEVAEGTGMSGTVRGNDGRALAVTDYPGCDPNGCNTRLTCSTNLC